MKSRKSNLDNDRKILSGLIAATQGENPVLQMHLSDRHREPVQRINIRRY